MDRQLDRAAALASLRERWGSAAPRPATEVFGALAAAPRPVPERGGGGMPAPDGPTLTPGHRGPVPGRPTLVPLPGFGPAPAARPRPANPDRVLPTGFLELDALLVTGGLPRAGTVALAGVGSSGTTTVALRAVAGAQSAGCLAAWIDLSRSLDPVEAVARGVRLEWLAVLVPDGTGEALTMAGSLLQARAVDVVVLDLATIPMEGPGPRPSAAMPRPADQLARLAAFARRTGALLIVLLPAGAPAALRATVEEAAGLRLELRRRGWIRLGREVVGQLAEARVARDRHGAPDRRTELRILYADGGPRDRCLRVPGLLVEEAATPAQAAHAPPGELTATGRVAVLAATRRDGSPPDSVAITRGSHRSSHAPAPSLLAAPRHPARPVAVARRARDRARGPRRAAVG